MSARRPNSTLRRRSKKRAKPKRLADRDPKAFLLELLARQFPRAERAAFRKAFGKTADDADG